MNGPIPQKRKGIRGEVDSLSAFAMQHDGMAGNRTRLQFTQKLSMARFSAADMPMLCKYTVP